MKSEDWISVLDKLPGNEREVLVWIEEGPKFIGVYVGSFDLNQNRWDLRDFSSFKGSVTHWMEILIPLYLEHPKDHSLRYQT